MKQKLIVYVTVSDYFNVVCKVVEKLYFNKKRCLVLANSPEEECLLDAKLWSYSKLSFIPHGSLRSVELRNAKFCYAWISEKITFENDPEVLIKHGRHLLNTDKIPTTFDTLIDVFDYNDMDFVRNKYANMPNCTLWVHNGTSWENLSFDLLN